MAKSLIFFHHTHTRTTFYGFSLSRSLMNIAAVMVSVEEPNSKQKQNGKTRTDGGYFEQVP
jgi:hypothetical protein